MNEKTYVLWVDEGEGWYAHSHFNSEEEAEKASNQFDYTGCYFYIDIE